MITRIPHKKQLDTVHLYCVYIPETTPELKGLFIHDDGTLTTVDFSETEISEISEGLFFAEIVVEDINGYLLGMFGDGSFCISVESEIPKVFVFNKNQVEISPSTLEYTMIDNNGGVLQDGSLEEIDEGFYQILLGQEAIEADQFVVLMADYAVKIVNSMSDADTSNAPSQGTILLNSNVWQQIAIPLYDSKIKDFCDDVATKYGVNPSDIIEICTAYFGDENQFRSYIPGVTNADSDNNFPLIYTDAGNDEVSGIWVKTKDLSSIGIVVYEWKA